MTPQNHPTAARKANMALLAEASLTELAVPIGRVWAELRARDLKPVETGLVMLRGRIGGDGAPFNLGEATATRAVIALETGETGFACVLGRDPKKARLAAIADALWQQEASRGLVEAEVLQPIARRVAAERSRSAAETAATKVDFFTLVRGDA